MTLSKLSLYCILQSAVALHAYSGDEETKSDIAKDSCSQQISCKISQKNLETIADISGLWLVHWKKLYTPKELEQGIEGEIINMDEDLYKTFEEASSDGHGFLTMQKELIFEKAQTIGLYLANSASARNVWINDELVIQRGFVASSQDEEVFAIKNEYVNIKVRKGINKVTIQMSNFHHYRGGGARHSQLMTSTKLEETLKSRTISDALSIGAILIMSFYHLFLWFIRKKDMGSFFFALFCLSVGTRALAMGGSQLIFNFIDPSWGAPILVKFEFFGFAFGSFSLVCFFYTQFYKEFKKWTAVVMGTPYLLWTLLILTTTANIFPRFLSFFQFWTLVSQCVAILCIILAMKRRRDGAGLSLTGFLLFSLCVTHDILRNLGKINSAVEISQFGMFTFLFFQSTILAYRFNKSFIKLDQAEKEIRLLNQDLEKKVEQRTQQINTILTNVQSGFLIISEDCIIQPGFTESCHGLLGAKVQNGVSCFHYFKAKSREADLFKSAVAQTFTDRMPESVNLAQIPNRINGQNNRVLSILYSVIRDRANNMVTGILLTINDASSLVKAEQQVVKSKIIVKILQNKTSFDCFVQDFRKHCQMASNFVNKSFQKEARSILHTLKGNAATFGFQDTVDVIHMVEEESSINPSDIDLIKDSLLNAIDEFNDIIDIDQGDRISIPKKDIEEYIARISQSSDEILSHYMTQELSNHTLPKAKQILGPIEDMVSNLSYALEKEIRFKFTGKDCPINQEHVDVVRNMIHLIRNAVDHGIEEVYERNQKDPTGTIHLSFLRNDSSLRIEVRDDGKGIDTERLSQVALENAITEKLSSEEERLNLIFHPGLSSKDRGTKISGRGIGLHAVKQAVIEVGGTITVLNNPPKGCNFIIVLPFTPDVSLAS